MLNNLTIKAKILTLLIVSLTILAGVVATISISNAKDALIKESYAKLTTANNIKKKQIEQFIHFGLMKNSGV